MNLREPKGLGDFLWIIFWIFVGGFIVSFL